jgi:hypothetical protein
MYPNGNLPPVSGSAWRRQAAALVGILAVIALVPLAGRLVTEVWGPEPLPAVPSYLPSLEASRPRLPFVATPIQDLREAAPGIVIVGDSMAGRIDENHLAEIAGTPVLPVLMNATGSAYWYLVLKNYVVESGVKPGWVLVFFRDTNLTDVAFRLDGPYRPALDAVARDREPELDRVVGRRAAGAWSGVYRATESVYHVRRMRDWMEPALNAWPAHLVAATGRERQLLERVNGSFTLDKFRSVAQADVAAADDREANFRANVDRSVLPLMLDVAKSAGLRLCFVRVMRRPVDGQPPAVSPALSTYMHELSDYVRANGAYFIDDHEDPSLAQLPYGDGDHISRDARVPYTDRFWPKLRALAK